MMSYIASILLFKNDFVINVFFRNKSYLLTNT